MKTLLALTLLLAGACAPDGPPLRSSPVLEPIDTLPRGCAGVVRPAASYLYACDGGLWRIADGAASRIADGPAWDDELDYFEMAVGADESVWIAQVLEDGIAPERAEVQVFHGGEWTTHATPDGEGHSIHAIAARAGDDAFALVSDGTNLSVCAWNGDAFGCEPAGLEDGREELFVSESAVYRRSGGALMRRDRAGTVASEEEVLFDADLGDVLVLEDDTVFVHLFPGSDEDHRVGRLDGAELTPIARSANWLTMAGRSASDLWLLESEGSVDCIREDLTECGNVYGRWQQDVVLHWDGSSLEELGHVDRYDVDASDEALLLPAGADRAWLGFESWWEARR
jgi:hypothetical protein